jgi:hypothetical protein
MRPSFFSKRAHAQQNRGWFQSGLNIQYEESVYRKEINEYNKPSEKHWM